MCVCARVRVCTYGAGGVAASIGGRRGAGERGSQCRRGRGDGDGEARGRRGRGDGDGDGELLEGSCLGTSREMEEALGEGEGETICGWISLLALGVNGGSWADPSRKFRLGRWFWAGWTPSLFVIFF